MTEDDYLRLRRDLLMLVDLFDHDSHLVGPWIDGVLREHLLCEVET